MFTQPPTFIFSESSLETDSSFQPSLLPEAKALFYPNVESTMLSDDKITSCEGFPNATRIDDNPGATIISPIALSVVGISGQFVALFYLHRTMKPSQHRTVFYLMLATLIWTDLIGKLITTPPAIISYVNGSWVGGKEICNFHGLFMMTITMVTHLLVTAMALDRFLCVRHGYFYKSSVTRSRVRLVLLGIWILSFVYCAMPLFGVGQYEPQYPGTWCFINIHLTSRTPWYHALYTNIFGFVNITCVVVILICNMIVIGTLITTRIARDRKLSADSRSSQKILSMTTQRELEFQMSIVLFVITIVFLLSWVPLDFRLFLNQIWPHTCREEHMSDLIAVRLASLNQIIDPWAYIICRKVFTSKIWRSCRSIVIGRNFSSKRHRISTNQQQEIGGSTKALNKESPSSSIRRKYSLPTPEKCKLFSKVSVQHVNELEPFDKRVIDVYTRKGQKPSKFFQQNVDSKKKFYLPLFKVHAPPNKDSADHLLPVEDPLAAIPCTALYRRQFRLNDDVTTLTYNRENTPLICHSFTYSPIENSLTESENDQLRENYNYRRVLERRHSWGCSPSRHKLYRTTSTQTLEDV